MRYFRIDKIKSVSAEVLDESGKPTGEFVEIIDNTGVLFDSELVGKTGLAEEVSSGDAPQWSVVSITC